MKKQHFDMHCLFIDREATVAVSGASLLYFKAIELLEKGTEMIYQDDQEE